MVFSILAYNIRHWAKLVTVVSIMGVPLLFFYFYLPESPRWLHGKRRLDESNRVLQKIALGNGTVLKEEFRLTYDNSVPSATATKNPKEASVFDLFKYPSTALMTVIMLYSWFVTAASYYGLTLIAGSDT